MGWTKERLTALASKMNGCAARLPVVVACAMAGVHASADAAFVRYVVTAIDVEHQGQQLTVYTVAARFDAPNDAVLLAFGLNSENPEHLKGFWHLDAVSSADPEDESAAVPAAPPPVPLSPLSQSAGSWNPSLVLKPKINRAFDSYLTIGGEAGLRNPTNADGSWTKADRQEGRTDSRGWARPDLPAIGTTGWFLVAPPSDGIGRAGASPNYEINGKPTLENAATDVRLAQFVLTRGHAPRAFTLQVAWNDGAAADPTKITPNQIAQGKFELGSAAATR